MQLKTSYKLQVACYTSLIVYYRINISNSIPSINWHNLLIVYKMGLIIWGIELFLTDVELELPFENICINDNSIIYTIFIFIGFKNHVCQLENSSHYLQCQLLRQLNQSIRNEFLLLRVRHVRNHCFYFETLLGTWCWDVKVFHLNFYWIENVPTLENKNSSTPEIISSGVKRTCRDESLYLDSIKILWWHVLVITLHLTLMKTNPSFVVILHEITITCGTSCS